MYIHKQRGEKGIALDFKFVVTKCCCSEQETPKCGNLYLYCVTHIHT